MWQKPFCSSEEPLTPYTIEELRQRIAISERDLAEGRCRDIEELFREWDEEEARACYTC